MLHNGKEVQDIFYQGKPLVEGYYKGSLFYSSIPDFTLFDKNNEVFFTGDGEYFIVKEEDIV